MSYYLALLIIPSQQCSVNKGQSFQRCDLGHSIAEKKAQIFSLWDRL
jgi:hypothetical protein